MFGLKYIFVWILANYSYDNLLKTYTSYYSENTFDSMSQFIEKQQYREDQLREECNLQYYKIKQPKTNYENMKDTFSDVYTFGKSLIYHDAYDYLIEPLLYLPQPPLYIDSLHDMKQSSYEEMNLNRILVLENYSYTLVIVGAFNTTPTWSMDLGNHTLTITDIK